MTSHEKEKMMTKKSKQPFRVSLVTDVVKQDTRKLNVQTKAERPTNTGKAGAMERGIATIAESRVMWKRNAGPSILN